MTDPYLVSNMALTIREAGAVATSAEVKKSTKYAQERHLLCPRGSHSQYVPCATYQGGQFNSLVCSELVLLLGGVLSSPEVDIIKHLL